MELSIFQSEAYLNFMSIFTSPPRYIHEHMLHFSRGIRTKSRRQNKICKLWKVFLAKDYACMLPTITEAYFLQNPIPCANFTLIFIEQNPISIDAQINHFLAYGVSGEGVFSCGIK